MNVRYEGFFDAARFAGWHCESCESKLDRSELPMARYPWLPDEYVCFLENTGLCVSADETCWLLTVSDFRGQTENAFQWNEFEKLSLDASAGDAKLEAEIPAFWAAHCPIAITLRSGYGYVAIRRDGCIVNGWEPEFEEPIVVASSFSEFLLRIEGALRGEGEGFLDCP